MTQTDDMPQTAAPRDLKWIGKSMKRPAGVVLPRSSTDSRSG